ncbi:hypothetical protein HMI56_002776, partial [Coelomomyces lativittatus]
MFRSPGNSFHLDTFLSNSHSASKSSLFKQKKKKKSKNHHHQLTNEKRPFQSVPIQKRLNDLSHYPIPSSTSSLFPAFNATSSHLPPRASPNIAQNTKKSILHHDLSSSSLPISSQKHSWCPFEKPLLFKESTPLFSTFHGSSHNPSTILDAIPDSSTLKQSIYVTECNSLQRPSPTQILFKKSILTKKNNTVCWKLRPVGSGLVNEGCTCYCNATLQALLYLPPFIQVFETKIHSSK